MLNNNFNFKEMMSSLKKEEEESKKLTEKIKFKFMGKANDAMADFLEEVEKAIPEGPKKEKIMEEIDDDWDTLWDKIVILIKKL